MKLNIDDTQTEEFMNSRPTDHDAMLNCECCHRLFYKNRTVALRMIEKKIPLLCTRCVNLKSE